MADAVLVQKQLCGKFETRTAGPGRYGGFPTGTEQCLEVVFVRVQAGILLK